MAYVVCMLIVNYTHPTYRSAYLHIRRGGAACVMSSLLVPGVKDGPVRINTYVDAVGRP